MQQVAYFTNAAANIRTYLMALVEKSVLIEYAATQNWIVGLEYQRVTLDTKNHCVSDPCVPTSTNNHDMSGDIDIVRARISYKFGRPEPVAEPMK